MACCRFYNTCLKDIYTSCVLPTETASTVSYTILSSLYSQNVERRSAWSQTTWVPPHSNESWPKMSSLSLPFLGLVSTVREAQGAKKRRKTSNPPQNQLAAEAVEGEPKRKKPFQRKEALLDGQMRTYKVLMLPTPQQKKELKRCFAVARQAYNYANALVQGGQKKNFIELRTLWVEHTKQLPVEDDASAHNERPIATKIAARAIKQLLDAYATNETKRKKRMWLNAKYPDAAKPLDEYVVHDRTIFTPTEVIIIDKHQKGCTPGLRKITSLPDRGESRSDCLAFFGNNLTDVGGIHLHDSTRCIKSMVLESGCMKEDAKILWDKATDGFHFIYAFTQPILLDPDPSFSNKRIVATDPGCYPFQAWYSPTSGCHGELMHGGTEELKARLRKLEALEARVKKRAYKPPKARYRSRKSYNHSTRRLEKKLAKERRRQHEWVRNAHYDAANFLLRNHDIVIQPVLQVSRLVKTNDRNVSKETTKVMLAWSHRQFRQRLRSAAFRYPGRHVLETKEPGTSKTCTNCGHWHSGLRVSDKVYVCPACAIQVNRQTAGARNNFFAAYGESVGIGWDGLSS